MAEGGEFSDEIAGREPLQPENRLSRSLFTWRITVSSVIPVASEEIEAQRAVGFTVARFVAEVARAVQAELRQKRAPWVLAEDLASE